MQFMDKLVEDVDFWTALQAELTLEEMIGWVKDRLFERGISYDSLAEQLGWPREQLDKVLFIHKGLEVRDVLAVIMHLGGRVRVE